MADVDLRLDRRAIESLNRTSEARAELQRQATEIRGRARQNAAAIDPTLASAIETDSGVDEDGAWADIGYDEHNPGFVLWWHEVGTVDFPARPHLRPAVRPGS